MWELSKKEKQNKTIIKQKRNEKKNGVVCIQKGEWGFKGKERERDIPL